MARATIDRTAASVPPSLEVFSDSVDGLAKRIIVVGITEGSLGSAAILAG